MWKTFRDVNSGGRTFYYNCETGETSWLPPPLGEKFSPFPEEDIAIKWEAFRSPQHNNELFFLNSLTKECTWDRPFGFVGMPKDDENNGMTCSEDSGPFIQYSHPADHSPYFYNPFTKFTTTLRPALIRDEEDVYREMKSQGLLWEGGSQEVSQMVSVLPASPSSSNSSSSGEEEEDDEEDDGPKRVFFHLLASQGVTHVSRWMNWAPKLAKFPLFSSTPVDVAKTWFDAFVQEQVKADSKLRQTRIEEAQALLRKETSRNEADFSAATLEALKLLKPSDREFVLMQRKDII